MQSQNGTLVGAPGQFTRSGGPYIKCVPHGNDNLSNQVNFYPCLSCILRLRSLHSVTSPIAALSLTYLGYFELCSYKFLAGHGRGGGTIWSNSDLHHWLGGQNQIRKCGHLPSKVVNMPICSESFLRLANAYSKDVSGTFSFHDEYYNLIV